MAWRSRADPFRGSSLGGIPINPMITHNQETWTLLVSHLITKRATVLQCRLNTCHRIASLRPRQNTQCSATVILAMLSPLFVNSRCLGLIACPDIMSSDGDPIHPQTVCPMQRDSLSTVPLGFLRRGVECRMSAKATTDTPYPQPTHVVGRLIREAASPGPITSSASMTKQIKVHCHHQDSA